MFKILRKKKFLSLRKKKKQEINGTDSTFSNDNNKALDSPSRDYPEMEDEVQDVEKRKFPGLRKKKSKRQME